MGKMCQNIPMANIHLEPVFEHYPVVEKMNEQTGEVDSYALRRVMKKVRRGKDNPPIHRNYAQVDLSRITELRISGTAFRVLFMLARQMDHETMVSDYSITRIAHVLGLKYQTAYVAVKTLMDLDIIERVSRGAYRVSPEYLSRQGIANWDSITRQRRIEREEQETV
jgi:DNA-binding MarR family transcriptional regulator